MKATESLWIRTVSNEAKETLTLGRAKTRPSHADVIVIGAGMCGILTAHFLARAGKSVLVLEAEQVGGGQTRNTTAKITAQHGLIYHRLLTEQGKPAALQYAAAAQAAIEEYAALIRDYAIPCSFRYVPSSLYTNDCLSALEQEAAAARTLSLPATLSDAAALPFPAKYALTFPEQAQFHPLEFLYRMSKGLPILTRTRVLKVEEHTVFCDRGTFTADHIVFACHYPFVNFPGWYFPRMHQERSYVLAVQTKARETFPEALFYGIDQNGLSFRTAGDYLLCGGGSHRTGKAPETSPYVSLAQQVTRLFPDAQIAASWSAQDILTADGIPYIGAYAKSRPYWYVATGFQKWGMTTSMTAALVLCGQITGRPLPYAPVFSPDRPLTASAKKAVLGEIKESSIALSKEFLTFPLAGLSSLPKETGRILHVGAKKVGVYQDSHGKLYFVSVKCPHLGCELAFNPAEKTWDCPCHGSRFDYRGNLISGPATTGAYCNCKRRP